IVARYSSVVPLIVTPRERRFLYFTGSSVPATGVTAWASVSCFSSASAQARVKGGRLCTLSHSACESTNQLPRVTYRTSAPMPETFFTNDRFIPSIAVPISVTVTMPITMPSVVSTERNLFARIALQEIARPSRSSVRRFMADQVVLVLEICTLISQRDYGL